ncbi:hypothetical protein K458DRAFT_486840 [Lentithecium fluviatile CBS 122367]|uniref:Large ribosomal subunit protein bL27m n=1 Tax=Lentithecium fluviatile CBS 122367 TaxID=1168545 RepID=A0A6G1J4S9_9PLEO|nr:hypothetical protein K458DRAFT_486840 [Lentithecium fluviatile CBS 122367]
MLLPRIFAPVRASPHTSSIISIPTTHVLAVLRTANGASTPVSGSASTPFLSFTRHASHQAQGRANGAKDGPGKRLGAKKSGGEYVIPGNIIFRQRGTAWFPGENCKFGRDHCVFATESGYVRYYRDPFRHPKRQYIGVALKKEDTLPYPRNAARRRRLNMVTAEYEPQPEPPTIEEQVVAGDLQIAEGMAKDAKPVQNLVMGKGYAYREANWDIGRAAERANVQVKEFVPGDRWAAWRKSQARREANIEKKKLRNAGKKTKPAKARKRG